MAGRARWPGLIAGWGLAVLAAAPIAGAWAAPPARPGIEAARLHPAGTRAYWTPARMAGALPVDVPATAAQLPLASPTLESRGRADAIEPAPAAAKGGRRVRAAAVAHPSEPPFRTHGKVFFRSGGADYVCSGTAVRSRTRSLVWTAGHCVHDSSGFVSRFMFVPAYRNGNAPFGRWAARRLFTTAVWADAENLHYDVGAARVARRDGRRLQAVVGARGIAFNRPYDQRYAAFGYPAEPNATTLRLFDGERMYVCNSGDAGRDDPGGGGPDTHAINCDMTGGSSGGGWIVDGRYVNSNVSYGYQLGVGGVGLGDNKIYGPYFGSVIEGFYRDVRGRSR